MFPPVATVEEKTGINPYQFGFIGSTDSHTGLATAAEENFCGKHSGAEPDPERYSHALAQFGDKRLDNYNSLAAGWALTRDRDSRRLRR